MLKAMSLMLIAEPGEIGVCSQVSGQPSNGATVNSHAWHSEQESGC